MWLYTGKVGFIIDNVLKCNIKYFIDLVVCLFGNLFGIGIFSAIVKSTRSKVALENAANGIVAAKRTDGAWSIFALSMMCGFMIYFAVSGHANCEGDFTKDIFIFLAVAVFILSGYEHCIANFSYYVYSETKWAEDIGSTLWMALGNTAGSVVLDFLVHIAKLTGKWVDADAAAKKKQEEEINNFNQQPLVPEEKADTQIEMQPKTIN